MECWKSRIDTEDIVSTILKKSKDERFDYVFTSIKYTIVLGKRQVQRLTRTLDCQPSSILILVWPGIKAPSRNSSRNMVDSIHNLKLLLSLIATVELVSSTCKKKSSIQIMRMACTCIIHLSFAAEFTFSHVSRI